MRTVVAACMRNEGPWLLEWVAHHLELGFDAIWICTNDLSDGSDALLDRLHTLGVVRHLRNPARPGESPQVTGYAHMLADAEFAAFDWALVVDADEFLVLPAGGDLAGFLAARHHASAIAVPWRVFGSDGRVEAGPGLVSERFRSFSPSPLYKSFCRPADTATITMHYPVLRPGRRFIHADGSEITQPASAVHPAGDHAHGCINHYISKSLAEMCAKVRRGRGSNREARPVSFMAAHALLGGQRDEGIARYRDGTRARLAALAADPLVAQALRDIDERFRQLLAEPETRELLAAATRAMRIHAPLRTSVASGCKGAIEAVRNGLLIGWAAALDDGQLAACRISIDGRPARTTAPHVLRRDLLTAGLGDGRRGFRLRLPPVLVDCQEHRVTLEALDAGGQVVGRIDNRLPFIDRLLSWTPAPVVSGGRGAAADDVTARLKAKAEARQREKMARLTQKVAEPAQEETAPRRKAAKPAAAIAPGREARLARKRGTPPAP